MRFDAILPPDGLNDWNDALRAMTPALVTPDRVPPSLPCSPSPDENSSSDEETKPGKTERGDENNEPEMKIAYRIAVRPPQGCVAPAAPRCARPCPGRPGRGAGGVFQKPMREGHPDEQNQHDSRTGNRGGRTNRAPRDHYQEVTDRIIAALEAGTPPWRKPWDPDKAGGPAMPRNAATGHRYRGINVLTLGMSALAFSSGDPRWATYKQAEDRGWQVRKGERGTTGYFFKRLELRDDTQDRRTTKTRCGEFRCCARSPCSMPARSTAFRITSRRRSRKRRGARRRPRRSFSPTAAPSSGIGGDRAFYSPSTDHIQMPPHAAFATAEGFCGALLHEMSHWTGAAVAAQPRSAQPLRLA